MKLNELKQKESAKIKQIQVHKSIKKRLLDLGMTKDTTITKILENKNMCAYNIKGSIIALRKTDTKDIEVEK